MTGIPGIFFYHYFGSKFSKYNWFCKRKILVFTNSNWQRWFCRTKCRMKKRFIYQNEWQRGVQGTFNIQLQTIPIASGV